MPDSSRESDPPAPPTDVLPASSAAGGAEFAGLDSPLSDESIAGVHGTALAPSCPLPLDTAVSRGKPVSIHDFQPGYRLDDFEIVCLLGRGAFGAVYLARQISLDRQVALKITAMPAGEGRKMARLEHEHIVQVFSEASLDNGTRLLCMQYVPGPTLQDVLDSLASAPVEEWSGQLLLETIDQLTVRSALFDPNSARNRELLANFDWVETVCWIGLRLAEALDYAHSHGVIHRDIKPGNIMISQYGRPMLVDFNLASQRVEAGASDDCIGGTLAYMAPEQLDSFIPGAKVRPDSVAQTADIFSLGVVIYQMACGELPYARTPKEESKNARLRALAAERRQPPPVLPPRLPKALDQVVTRCMDQDPSHRYGTGRELRAVLEGCLDLQAAERGIPDVGRMRGIAAVHPFVWLIVLALAPQIVATVINIVYNEVRIIRHLTQEQQAIFGYVILGYNSYGYITGLAIATVYILPVWRAWRMVRARLPADRAAIDLGRRSATVLPRVAAITSCLGWLPGGLVFPLCLRLVSGTLSGAHWAHLFISFTISGLIALTYSALFVQWLSLCVFYPRLWCDRQGFRKTAATELQDVPRRLRLLQVLAGVIPLAGAVLMLIGAGPADRSDSESLAFRVLVAGLIILGAIGFCLSMFATALLTRALAAITGSEEVSEKKVLRS